MKDTMRLSPTAFALTALSGIALLLSPSVMGCGEDSTVPNQRYSQLFGTSFAVGDSSVLEVSNFAGNVDVVPGNPGGVRVAFEKWAGREEDLDQIEVELVKLPNGVRVVSTNPLKLSQVSVDLEITVPPDTRPTLENGAGNIGYEGLAEGLCRFATGAGSITLELPADVNIEVYLATGAGSIHVGFLVIGQGGSHLVEGIIGTGLDGRVEAQTGAGNITLIPQ